VELEQNHSSSSTSLSRATVAVGHGNSIGKHAWLTGQATITSTQKQGGGEETHRSAHRGARQKTMAVTRRCSHGCGSKATVQRLHRRGGGIVLTVERPSTAWRRRRGCSSHPNDVATRGTPQALRSLGGSSSEARRSRSSRKGEIHWGGARRRWRRLEVKMTKPFGQKEARDEAEQIRHRAAADLAGARRSRARSSSAIWDRRRGIRVRTDREGRE
jgi:hypothetical protein